ncbi:type II secretion system protein [Clostridium thermobutyricum]|uniref:type II secretion system protein n=1 Tax=Clostridium thermobutyricum TaxID=29372 RepID=UPI0018AAA95B|nr:prepilin-type N-terminal cleavage/methylation domain-containing protein [Clostridium thermobutyricum]
MRNLIKNKKKKGFTLIEMVAVVAIIGILAALLIPKVTGYMNEAKKTKVIDQARKVVQAYEGAKMKGRDVTGITTVKSIDAATGVNVDTQKFMRELITGNSTTNASTVITLLPEDTTIGQCYAINEGNKEFKLNGDALDINSITGSIPTP